MRLFSVEKVKNKKGKGPRVKIGIAVPTHGHWPWQFGASLCSLTEHLATGVAGTDIETQLYIMAGTYVHTARNKLLMRMLADECTHMLWIDSDMAFPPNSLKRLLAHVDGNDGVKMVGINYSTRGFPPRYVAIKRISTEEDLAGELCETGPDSTGLEEVEALGFGMVLMKSSIFNNMDITTPNFWFEMIGNTIHHIGEDVYFCRKVREAGEKIYVDHDLSKECKHVGLCEYELGIIWAAEQVAV